MCCLFCKTNTKVGHAGGVYDIVLECSDCNKPYGLCAIRLITGSQTRHPENTQYWLLLFTTMTVIIIHHVLAALAKDKADV